MDKVIDMLNNENTTDMNDTVDVSMDMVNDIANDIESSVASSCEINRRINKELDRDFNRLVSQSKYNKILKTRASKLNKKEKKNYSTPCFNAF